MSSSSVSRPHRGVLLLNAAVAGAVFYLTVVALLPFLQPGHNLLRDHPEDYAGGGVLGLAPSLSYAAFAIALLALAAALPVARGRRGLSGLLLMSPAALCAALVGDPVRVAAAGLPVTVGVLLLGLAPLVIGVVLRERLLSMLGFAVLLGLIALIGAPDEIGGVVNRVFDALAGAWVVVAALVARHPAAVGR